MNRHCVRNYIDGKEIFSMSNYLSREVIIVCSNKLICSSINSSRDLLIFEIIQKIQRKATFTSTFQISKKHFKIMNLYLLFLFMPLHTCVQFRTKCNLRPSRRVILCQFLMYRLPFTWYKSQDKCNNWKNNKKLETRDSCLYLTWTLLRRCLKLFSVINQLV